MKKKYYPLDEVLEILGRKVNRDNKIILLKELHERQITLFAYDDFSIELDGFFFHDDFKEFVDEVEKGFEFVETKHAFKRAHRRRPQTFKVKVTDCFLRLRKLEEFMNPNLTPEKGVSLDKDKLIVTLDDNHYQLGVDQFKAIEFLYNKYISGNYSRFTSDEIFNGAGISLDKHKGQVSQLFSKKAEERNSLLDNIPQKGWRLSVCPSDDNE